MFILKLILSLIPNVGLILCAYVCKHLVIIVHFQILKQGTHRMVKCRLSLFYFKNVDFKVLICSHSHLNHRCRFLGLTWFLKNTQVLVNDSDLLQGSAGFSSSDKARVTYSVIFVLYCVLKSPKINCESK